MNRTKIEWTDLTWNPCTGCLHGCWYCYAKKLAQRFPKVFPRGFKPTFYPDRLLEPWKRKKPAKIFVCSISDLFAPWIPRNWMETVIKYCWLCPVPHTFQFLTKHPEMIPPLPFPENFWMGTTVTMENQDWKKILKIKNTFARGVKFVSFEPLLGRLPSHVSLGGIDWIIIGKLTSSKKVKLDYSWVHEIEAEAMLHKIPIFMKNNLKPEFPGKLIQEFPKIETRNAT